MKKLLSIILFFILPLGIVLGQSPSHIYIKSDYMVLSGGTSAKPIYLVINNSDTNALVPNSGWIISENEFNMVLWNIGNSTGIYRVPFGLSTSAYLPLKLNISTAGIGSGGAIKFSTYHTAALNSGAEPSDVTNLTPFILSGSPSNTDNSYNVADRFYIIDANTGYSTKPTAGNITFSYISGSGPSSEIASPNILTESRLMAERFNSGSSTWSDWFGEGCSDAVASGVGTVQTGPVTASNFYRSWALWDNLMTLPLTISSTNIICYGSSTGSAMVTVSGGTAPYTYSWAPSGGTSATASSLSAGTYSVTVTDNTGCSGTASSTITQPDALRDSISSVTHVSYNGGSNGSVTVGVKYGTSPYTYSWTLSLNSTATASSLMADNYTITVTDNCGATATASVTITQPYVSPVNPADTNINIMYLAYLNDTTKIANDTSEDDAQNDFVNYYEFLGPRLQPSGSFKLQQEGVDAYYNYFNTHGSSAGITATWAEAGPLGTTGANIGRLITIDFDPNNSNVMFAGGWDGGVFKSTNSGSSWTVTNSDQELACMSVNSIVVDPLNSDYVYASTGDEDGHYYYSAGVYQSTNGGIDWTTYGPFSTPYFSYTGQLAIDPTAASGSNVMLACDDGVLELSGFNIWTNTHLTSYSTAIVVDPQQTVVKLPSTFGYWVFAAGYHIYMSSLPGVNLWTDITGPGSGLDLSDAGPSTYIPAALHVFDPTKEPSDFYTSAYASYVDNYHDEYIGRIALWVTSDGNYLYADMVTSCVTPGYVVLGQQHVFKYTIAIGTWTQLPDPENMEYTSYSNPNSTASGHIAITTDPSNDNIVYASSVNGQVYNPAVSATSWQVGINSNHTDIHDIAFSPFSPHDLFVASDGGLTNATTGISLNSGLNIATPVQCATTESSSTEIITTDQDNGGFSYDVYASGWQNSFGGSGSHRYDLSDGTTCTMDYTSANTYYVASLYGDLDQGDIYLNGSFYGQMNPDDIRRGQNPIMLDPFNHLTLYEGRQELVVAANGKTASYPSCNYPYGCDGWAAISSFENQILPSDPSAIRVIQALAICPTNNQYIYASLESSENDGTHDWHRLAYTIDGGGRNGPPSSDWNDISYLNGSSHADNLVITGIAVSYTNPNLIWVCYSGYNASYKVASYNVSTSTWTDDASTSLPNLPANCIAYQNGTDDGLYVGTDAGVYYKDNTMSSWEKVGNNLPNTNVTSLDMNYCRGLLTASTYGRGTWQVPLLNISNTPFIASGTWNSSNNNSTMYIPADIEIQATNTLTIASGETVEMGKGHKIIVDPGATLIVDGTITTACGTMWSGIQLNGNITQDQTSAYQGTVILNSGSILENAVNGITTNSGIITANGATFYNNQRDIQFFEYINPYHPSINKCFFKNCSFQTDQNYIWLNTNTYPLESRVTMWNVHGVNFQGNIFINSIPISGANSISDIYFRGNGIGSIDASYSANNCSCMSTYPPGGCCGTGNTFEGLGYGIEAFNSNPSDNIQITGNSFIDNYFDIDIQNMNNAIITNNSFSKTAKDGDESTSDPYNIYLDQCTGYNVSGNTLSNTFYINTGGAGKSYGTVVYNSGPTNNLINNNDFSGIYVQSQSQGTNGQKGADIINIFPPRSYIPNSGLQYHCNQYTSSVASGADISVVSGLIDPMQGSCTNATTTANNTFNNACGSRLNISVYPTILWDIFYSTPTTTPHPPYCESTPVQLNPCVNVTTANCSPTYTVNIIGGSLLTSYSVDYHTTLRTQKKSFLTSKDSLTGILARGSTSGLYTIISTGTAATILDSLLAPGPYLSDSVLKTAILAGLPMETLADILIPNTPLDSSVVATLDGIGLPDTLASRLNEYQADSILSPRNILIAGIDYFQALMDYTDNALITALETDTNFVGTFDSAQAVLKSDTLTLPRLAQLASLQWAAGENTTALVTLDTIHRRDVDSIYNKFYELMPMLMTLSGDSNGYLSLKGKATDSTLLEQIAMDTLKPGYANARAVLEFVYNQLFDEPILPLVSGGTHRPNKNNNYYIIGKDQTVNSRTMSLKAFNLFPNPAKNEVTIQYSLEKNIQNADVELYDEVGNKVLTWQLPLSQTQITENTANLPAGIYIYSIFANNAIVQRGKLVIER